MTLEEQVQQALDDKEVAEADRRAAIELLTAEHGWEAVQAALTRWREQKLERFRSILGVTERLRRSAAGIGATLVARPRDEVIE